MFEEVDFAGKKVLITAGADGLGLEMARVFHRAGARVFVCDVNESRLAALPAELPGARCAPMYRTRTAWRRCSRPWRASWAGWMCW